MADAYYRSLYFSLDSPEDLDILGMLLALPRRRQPSAIKSALRHYLPTVLDGPPLGPDEVRTIVVETRRARGRRRAHSQPDAPRRPSTARRRKPPRERCPSLARGFREGRMRPTCRRPSASSRAGSTSSRRVTRSADAEPECGDA